MRIRKKKWAAPELAECSYYRTEACRGHWREQFKYPDRPLYLEIGCGKGIFAAQHALKYPDTNIIAADIKEDMLGVARRSIEREFAEAGREQDNILLYRMNASFVGDYFDPSDRIERIYLNFSNPWGREKHKKRRLTHPRQLVQYAKFLPAGGEIRFKTDDDDLFEDSVLYFEECGFEIKFITRDLYSSGYEDNIVTEHERMFLEEGKTIKFLIAVKKSGQ